MSLSSDDDDYDHNSSTGIASEYDSDSVAYAESEWAEDPLQADYASPLTEHNPLFNDEVLKDLSSLIERGADHYKRYGYTIQTKEYAVALRLAETFSQVVKAMNYRYAYYDNKMRHAISRDRTARIELRNLVITQAEELALLKRRPASELVEVATPVPNHPQTLPNLKEEAATGPGSGTSRHGTLNVATSSRLPSSLSLSHTHSDRAQYQDRVSVVHLELRDAVGKLRLTVATAFASLFPNTRFSTIPINRLNGGIIWDTFLIRLNKHYRKYVTSNEDGNPVKGQVCSVFHEFATDSDSNLEPPSTQLPASDWKTITEFFVPHWVPPGLRPNEAAHRGNEDLKQMFRLFVPLFIWGYNECKEWLIFMESRLKGDEDVATSSPDRSYVFQFGSALDVRRHFNERTDQTYQSLIEVVSGAVERAIMNADSSDWDEAVLHNEHSKLLKKFNIIRKCLNILVDDALLDLLLSHDAMMSLYRRRSTKHGDDSVKSQMESLAAIMGKIDDDDVFSAEDETILGKKLIEVNNCLRDVDHYHGSNLISTEQRIDSFVEYAFLIRGGSEDNSEQRHDYTILQALLEALILVWRSHHDHDGGYSSSR